MPRLPLMATASSSRGGASLLSASGATDIYATLSRRGRTFGPPVRVNDTVGDARSPANNRLG
jgi:hypothetical protein